MDMDEEIEMFQNKVISMGRNGYETDEIVKLLSEEWGDGEIAKSRRLEDFVEIVASMVRKDYPKELILDASKLYMYKSE